MITRSRARADRACILPSELHSRIMRTPKVALREHTAPVSYESENMGRRGGTSGRRTSSRKKPVDTSNVTPLRLFAMAEEENRDDETVSGVS